MLNIIKLYRKNIKNMTKKQHFFIILSCLLFTLYFIFSVVMKDNNLENTNSLFVLLLVTTFKAFLFFIIIYNIHIYLFNNDIVLTLKNNSSKLFLIYLGICIFLGYLLYLNNYIPGYYDIMGQYEQAINWDFNNWHPFIHTFLFFEIPVLILGENLNNAVLATYLFSSVVFAYLCYSLDRFGVNKLIIVLVVVLTITNDSFVFLHSCITKDVPYSMAILALTIMCMWIYVTNGKWLESKFNIALLILFSFLILSLRHNGILSYTATFVTLIFIYKKYRKRLLSISVSTLVFFFILTGPIYTLIGVSDSDYRFSELMGIPNNILCTIRVSDGNISQEENEFLENIVTTDTLKTHYKIGSYNTVKWIAGNKAHEGFDFIEENKKEYLTVLFSLTLKNPQLALKAYIYTIGPILYPSLVIDYRTFNYSVGFALFLMLFFAISKSIKRPKKLLLTVPVLANFLGILITITGGEERFVLANYTTMTALIVFYLISVKNKDINNLEQKLKKGYKP